MALIYNWESFIRLHGGDEGARAVFEQLMDNLLRTENPGKEVHIIKAVQGDGGIDVGVWQADGLDVYQCKFFMDKMDTSRWYQVKDSFKRVLEFINSDKAKGVKLLNWFLCVPREMRKEDVAEWDRFCKDRKSLGIGLRYIDGNEIIRRLQECDRLQGTNFIDQYFGVTKNIPKCLTSIPAVNRTVGLVGRETVMKTVLSLLEAENRLALVSGLGGIGKTAVMQWICNDLKNKGNYVAWIDCGGSLKEDLLVLGEALGIAVADQETAYGAIINTLKNGLGGSLYLFLDNLTENPENEVLDDLNSLNAHIMVTSRGTNEAFPTIKLKELEEDQAVTMFFQYYNGGADRGYEDSARSIITSVNRHTLLTELLAKAAKKSGGTLEDFNARLEIEGVYNVFRRKVNTAHDGNATIEECVIKLYEVTPLSEEQKRIMKLFSVFTPEREIYWEVAEWAEFDLDEVDELVDLGWLERSGPENNFKIHQIIKDSLIRQMQNRNEELRLEEYGELIKKVADTENYMSRKLEYIKVRERLGMAEDIAKNLSGRADEMLEMEEITEENKGFLSDAAILFNNAAGVFREQGEYEKALEYYGKALAICERVLGPEHPDTGTTYHNMALVYDDQGEYGKALEYYGKALAIHERVLGPNHPDTGTTYNNMAGVFRAQGEYGKALEYYDKALSIREGVLGSDHPDTGTTYNNMALVYKAQGEYGKALEYYGKALSISERVLGPGHPDTGTTYHNMAAVYDEQGEYAKALEYYGKALSISERVLGPGHPDTGTTYNNIALVYDEQGEYEKALEYYGKTLAIFERVYGPDHPSTGTTYNNMAVVYDAQGEYDKALEYYGKALNIRERVLGSEHPDTGTTYHNMAFLFRAQGDYEKALTYYEKALVIRKLKLGENHPSTKATQLAVDEMKQFLKLEGEAE